MPCFRASRRIKFRRSGYLPARTWEVGRFWRTTVTWRSWKRHWQIWMTVRWQDCELDLVSSINGIFDFQKFTLRIVADFHNLFHNFYHFWDCKFVTYENSAASVSPRVQSCQHLDSEIDQMIAEEDAQKLPEEHKEPCNCCASRSLDHQLGVLWGGWLLFLSGKKTRHILPSHPGKVASVFAFNMGPLYTCPPFPNTKKQWDLVGV